MISISHTTNAEAVLCDALAGDAEVTPLMVNHDPVCYLVRPDDHPHLRTIVSWNQLQKVVETYETIYSSYNQMVVKNYITNVLEKLWEDMHDGKLFV